MSIYQKVLQAVTNAVESSSAELGQYVSAFEKYSGKGWLPEFFADRTEDMYKAAYKNGRIVKVHQAVLARPESEIKDLMDAVVQDCLERGFTRADLRHNSTNEMSNVTKRWAAECEAQLYDRYLDWQRLCK